MPTALKLRASIYRQRHGIDDRAAEDGPAGGQEKAEEEGADHVSQERYSVSPASNGFGAARLTSPSRVKRTRNILLSGMIPGYGSHQP
jgi:hypothetical protein